MTKRIIFSPRPTDLTISIRGLCPCDMEDVIKLIEGHLDNHPEKLVVAEKKKPCGCKENGVLPEQKP